MLKFKNFFYLNKGFYPSVYLLRNKKEIQLKCFKNFYITSICNRKLFVERENLYAHDILSKTEVYNIYQPPLLLNVESTDCIEKLLLNSHEDDSDKIFEKFKIVTKYCHENNVCISNDIFDSFVDAFTEKCHKFSDHQLIESLKYLTIVPETPIPNYKNFMELWSALDDATCARLENWKVETAIFVCEYWYKLDLIKKSQFVWHAIRKIGRKISKLDKEETVHSLFLCNLIRKPPIAMFEYELAWKKHFDNMTIQEIAIMSMGFFKTQTSIRSPELIENIYKQLLCKLDIAEDITLVNILKILRYSSRIPQADLMNELLDKLCPYIEKVSLLTCLHIGLLGIDLQNCHDKCIDLIVNRFYKEIKDTRLKDLERISHIMSLFNIHNKNGIKDDLSKIILLELRNRIPEITIYPKCFPNCLHYITLCGHHNEELINAALSDKFMRHAYGRNLLLGREIFCLDSYVQINMDTHYSGVRLTDKNRATMGKLLTNYIPERNSKYKLNVTDRILLEVKETIQDIVEYCSIKHVLPHFQRPDIILAYDTKQKQFIKFGKKCEDDYNGWILTRETLFDESVDLNDIITIVFVVNGWNNYVRNSERLTGAAAMKMRQLELLKHKHIQIPWHEWRNLENKRDRQEYIKRKLNAIIKF